MSNKFIKTRRTGFAPRRKIRVFVSGLRFAILGDLSVAYKVALSLVVLSVSFWFREWLDFLLIVIVTGQMVIAEIFNTAIEALCDYLQSEQDHKIKVIKDIAAAAAGISILIWIFTFVYEIWRIWQYFHPVL